MSMSSTYSDIPTIEHLFLKCKEKNNGTFLIATNNNKSCQITIVDGEVSHATMGKLKGDEVAEELTKQGIKKASFNTKMEFPHSKKSVVASSYQFLKRIGYDTSIDS